MCTAAVYWALVFTVQLINTGHLYCAADLHVLVT